MMGAKVVVPSCDTEGKVTSASPQFVWTETLLPGSVLGGELELKIYAEPCWEFAPIWSFEAPMIAVSPDNATLIPNLSFFSTPHPVRCCA
jgi:hypothetical protein